jgi:hypothetical protein
MEDQLLTIAGIAWDPHIRGILTVFTAVVILMGSIYLILYTNVGARLGFLLSAGGLFGWMFILGLTWWIAPPAIGPRGDLPSWEPVEIVFGDPAQAANGDVQELPYVCWSTTSSCELPQDTSEADRLIEENPVLFEEFLGNAATLSKLAVVAPEVTGTLDFGPWELTDEAAAGEAVSSADAILLEQGIFELPTEYMVLDSFEIGGKDERDGDSMVDRVIYTFTDAAQLRHPTHYAVVQVQPVVTVEPVPGEAPPLPEVDPDAPIVSIVMVRNLGNLRVPPALVTIGSGLRLAIFAYALHRRDRLTDEHMAEAGSAD